MKRNNVTHGGKGSQPRATNYNKFSENYDRIFGMKKIDNNQTTNGSTGLNLYLLSRADEIGVNEYISAVVAASSEEEAMRIHPDKTITEEVSDNPNSNPWPYGSTWCNLNKVICEKIGIAEVNIKKGVIMVNFFNETSC